MKKFWKHKDQFSIWKKTKLIHLSNLNMIFMISFITLKLSITLVFIMLMTEAIKKHSWFYKESPRILNKLLNMLKRTHFKVQRWREISRSLKIIYWKIWTILFVNAIQKFCKHSMKNTKRSKMKFLRCKSTVEMQRQSKSSLIISMIFYSQVLVKRRKIWPKH